MKCVVFLGFIALASAQVQIQLPFNNPAGVRLTGAGFANNFQFPQFQAFQRSAEPQQAQEAEQQQQPQPQAAQQEEQPQPQQYTAQQEQAQPEEQQQQQQQQYAAQQEQAQQEQAQANEQQQQQQQQQQYAAQAANEYVPPQPVPYNAPAQAQAYGYQQYQQVVAQPQFTQYHSSPALQYHTQYAAPAKLAYAAPAVQHHAYAKVAAPVAYQPAYHHAYAAPAVAAPAVAVHQKVGYAATPVLTKVHGSVDVPVTKVAYTQGITQKLVDVAQPAVTTRKVKVRRPALRKEFYDIEHRIIVRPAGSATLELSQPISKEQKGPTVLTPTKFVHHAPVVRYGASRQIVDGQGSPVPELQRSAAQPTSAAAPAASPRAGPSASPAPRDAADSEVVESADQPAEQQEQQTQAPVEEQQPQTEQPAQEQTTQQAQQEAEPSAAAPTPASAPGQGRALTITPNMPAELQARLIELLSSRGGTVTEILNEDGKPADSASVLQVADALGDPSLQGGERITTRRIVVTRPIETIQEIEVQEPATKYSRIAVNQPTLFKTAIPAIQRVPVAVPAIKHVATPVVKTTYAQPAYAYYHH